jgi:hypothetical protein
MDLQVQFDLIYYMILMATTEPTKKKLGRKANLKVLINIFKKRSVCLP